MTLRPRSKIFFTLLTIGIIGSVWWSVEQLWAESMTFIEYFEDDTYKDPVTTTADWNTDRHILQLSYAPSSWFKLDGVTAGTTNVSNTDKNSYAAQIALDADQNPMVIWFDMSIGRGDIFFTRWSPSANSGQGAWTHMNGSTLGYENLSANDGYSANPRMVLTTNHDPMVVWEDYSINDMGEILFRKWNGSAWTETVNLSNNAFESLYPQIALDANQQPVVVWEDYTGGRGDIFLKRFTSGAWQNIQNVSNTSGNSLSPQIAINDLNHIFVAWEDHTSPQSQIKLSRSTSGSTWQGIQHTKTSADIISTEGFIARSPALTLDQNGAPIVVWDQISTEGSQDIFFRRWNTENTAWTDTENISNTAGASWQPVIKVDKENQPIVFWYDATPESPVNENITDIFGTRYTSNFVDDTPAWTTLNRQSIGYDNISQTNDEASYQPQFILNGEDFPYVVWWEYDAGKYEISFSRWKYELTDSEQIAQSLTINGSYRGIKTARIEPSVSEKSSQHSIDYFLTNDGGENWLPAPVGSNVMFPDFGDDLRWKAVLRSQDTTTTPVIGEIAVYYRTTPRIASTYPADDGTGFPLGGTLQATFSEPVMFGKGAIEIYKVGQGLIDTKEIPGDPDTTINGNILSIKPLSLLEEASQYYVLIDSGAITATDGVPFLGIEDPEVWNFGSYNVSPSVTNFYPNSGTTDGNQSLFNITFSENITADPGGNISIYKAEDESLIQTFDIATQTTINANSISFELNTPLEDSTEYYILIDQNTIHDLEASPAYYAGIDNPLTWRFTTTNQLPTLSTLTPQRYEKNVPTDTQLILKFSEPIQIKNNPAPPFLKIAKTEQRIADRSINLQDTSIVQGFGTDTLTITLPNPFEDATQYWLTLGTDILEDLQGGTFKGINFDSIWPFTTINNLPTIQSLTPLDNTNAVDRETNLQITLSENVTANSGSITIKRTNDNSIFTSINITSEQVIIQDNVIDITLTEPFEEDVSYAVQITETALQDAQGGYFPGISDLETWNFTTRNLPPEIYTLTPTHETNYVSIEPTIQIQFNEPVISGSGTVQLKRVSDNTIIESWDFVTEEEPAAEGEAESSPAEEEPAAEGEAESPPTEEEPAAEDEAESSPAEEEPAAEGEAESPPTEEEPAAEDEAESSPAEEEPAAEDEAESSPAEEEPAAEDEAESPPAEEEPAAEGEAESPPAEGISSTASTTISLSLTNPLIHETEYQIIVPEGTFRDLQGANFAGIDPGDWTFKTTDATPEITAFTPEHAATEVPPRATIQDPDGLSLTVSFTEDVQVSQGATITFLKVADPNISISMVVDPESITYAQDGSHTVTIPITERLAYATTYEVRLSDGFFHDTDNDTQHAALNPDIWQFSTRVNAPPKIISRTPQRNEFHVETDTDLVMEFSEPVTFENGALTIKDYKTGAIIENFEVGSPSLTLQNIPEEEPTSAILTVNIAEGFASNTRYKIELDPQFIKDLDPTHPEYIDPDNVLIPWTFTTAVEGSENSNCYSFVESFAGPTYYDEANSSHVLWSDVKQKVSFAPDTTSTEGTVTSLDVSGPISYIRRVYMAPTHTIPEGTTLTYQISNDGITWTNATPNVWLTLPATHNDLKWRALFGREEGSTLTPEIRQLSMTYCTGYIERGTLVYQDTSTAIDRKATIKFINPETGATYQAQSDNQGQYEILIPGGSHYVRKIWERYIKMFQEEIDFPVADRSVYFALEKLDIHYQQTEDALVEVETSGGDAARTSGTTREEFRTDTITTYDEDENIVTGGTTKESFAAAYEESLEEIEKRNAGEAGKIVTDVDEYGNERFVGYLPGRISVGEYEDGSQTVRVRDIVRAEERNLNQTYLSSAEPEPLEQHFTTHDFRDVGIKHAYAIDIMKINAMGLLTPDSNHRFRPNHTLTWDEFLTAVTRAAHQKVGTPEEMYEQWIGGEFDTSAPPTRQDTLLALVNAMGLELNPLAVNSSFADITTDNELAPLLVAAKLNKWFLNFQGNVFLPEQYITRGELATLLVNAYENREEARPSALKVRLGFIEDFARSDEQGTENVTSARLGIRTIRQDSDAVIHLNARKTAREKERQALLQNRPQPKTWNPVDPNTERTPMERLNHEANIKRQEKAEILRDSRQNLDNNPQTVQDLGSQSATDTQTD